MPSRYRLPFALAALALTVLPAAAGGVVVVAPPVRVAPAPVVVVPPPYYYAPPPVAVMPYPPVRVVLPVREPHCRAGGVVYSGPRRTVVGVGRRCW